MRSNAGAPPVTTCTVSHDLHQPGAGLRDLGPSTSVSGQLPSLLALMLSLAFFCRPLHDVLAIADS